jgi:CSLREA domain-containing protein
VSSRNHLPSFEQFAKLFVIAGVAGAVLAAGLFVAGRSSSLQPKIDSPAAVSGLDAQTREAYGSLPLSFEANRGQVNSQAKYVARGSGYSLFLTPREAVFSLRAASSVSSVDENSSAQTKSSPTATVTNSVLRMSLVNANDDAKISGQDELPGKSNYFIGNDRQKWIKGVPSVAKVKYAGIYPGIDLTYYGNQKQLEYDFIVKPGSDPKQITLSFAGADEIKIDDAGELVLTVKGREVRQHKPVAYQEIDGGRREVASSYSLNGLRQIGFQLGEYDATKPLVIDPVLVYSTYFGGLGADTATAITVNGAGEAFITGTTASANFPGASLAGAATSNGDAYVAKLNAAGTAIVFASYFGGDNPDLANAITLDQSGNIYVAGSTQSFNFPTAGAPYQATKKGGPQMKKSADGGANYSAITTGLTSVNINGVAVNPGDPNTAFATSLGGEGLFKTTDGGAHWASARGNMPDNAANNAVAVDPTNPANVYLANCGPGGVYRSTDGGATWTGVAALGVCMNTIVTDAGGNIYAGGFDNQGVYRSTNGGSTWTNALIPGGGGGAVIALAAAPSSPGTIYAGTNAGVFKSTDFGQTWTVTGLNTGGGFDDSLAVDPANSQIVYAGIDQHDLKVSNNGGATWSIVNNLGIAANGFPTAIMIAPTLPTSTVYVGTTTNGILQSTDNGASWSPANISTDNVSMIAYAPSSVSTIYVGCLSGADAFVTKLNPTGSSLIYSTYLGGGTASDRGDKDDGANGIVVDPSGNAIVVGVTDTVDFPTQDPLAAFGGQADAFVAKLDSGGSSLLFSTTLGGPAVDACSSVALSPSGSVYITGQTLGTFPTLNPSQANNGGAQDAFVARLNPSGNNFTLGYSTYLGGTANDRGFSIALDSSDNAYVAGQTNSTTFPVLNAMQSVRGGTTDAFLTKFNPSGARVYSTYLGGSANDIARAVAVDAAGNAYVGGLTLSANFPLTNSVQSFGGGTDAFITKINPSGSAKVYSTYLGGAGTDQAMGVALDANNAVYITGTTSSTEIKPGAIQTGNGGSNDAFITKLTSSSGPSATDLSVTLLDDIDPIAVNNNLTYTANVTNVGEADVTAVTLTSNLPANTTFVSASAGCTGTSTVTCNLANMISGQSKIATIVVKPTSEGLITASVSVAAAQSESNTGNNTATQDTRVTIGTIYTVNSNADTDDGACTATGTGNGCTLREAINAANVNPSKDTILFSIGSGLQTIALSSSLPNLSNPVYIDATTQPGFAGQPIIEINGTSAAHCLYIPSTSSGSTVRGFVINRCGGHGIQIDGNNNTIQANYIGTNVSGSATLPVTFSGIFIIGSNNQIGSTTLAGRNVISGNGHQGIAITGSNNAVQGNYVGTNASGTAALGGGNVAVFQGGSNNMIGGTAGTTPGGACTGACNLLSGNNGPVSLGSGGGGTNNTVQGNYVGVSLTGTAAVPNNSGGIRLMGVSGNHIIGNLVSGNNNTGVSLFDAANPTANNDIRGNFIGTNAAGTAAIPNTGGGIEMHTAASGNVVGGATAADRNLVSGNTGDGISLSNLTGTPTGNIVRGNYVGTNKDGNALLSNTGQGVGLYGVTNNFVGGTNPGEGNLISGNNANGVNISSRSPGSGQPNAPSIGNYVQGNLIGTDITGTVALRNNQNGIAVSSSNGNFLGGTNPGARNVISGNTQSGISISNSGGFDPAGSNNNVIRGNYIGTKADGNSVLSNGTGISLGGGSTGNIIGGDDAADGATDGVVLARNIIAGSVGEGIIIQSQFVNGANALATGNIVQGNLIGGSTLLRNTGNGINLNGAMNTLVGGSSPGAGNTISFNNNNGIVVNCPALNNVVTCGVGNTFSRNSIFSHSNNLGIRLNANGANVGNNNQAPPVVSFVSASGAGTVVQGSLTTGAANQNYVMEFFANDSCGVSAQGEGKTYIGTYNVTTDANGVVSFTTPALDVVAPGKIVTATATHATNGTSRFSNCTIVSNPTATVSGRATDQVGTPLAGVTVTLSGGQNGSATTDAQGNYSFPNLVSSLSYTVSASLSGVTFYPASFTLTNLPADRTVNFTKAVASYTITDLGVLTAGPVSIGWDVNNAGQVTGWSSTATSTNFRPYFYNNGSLTNLTPLGTGSSALGIAINDNGRVVGYSDLTSPPVNGQVHAFFSDNGGALKEIGTFGGATSQAWGLNDNGVVVGSAQTTGNAATHPFIWKDTNNDGLWQQTEMIDIGQIGTGASGRLFAINNLGVAVGNSNIVGGGAQQPTLYKDDNNNGIADPGELRSLGTLGGPTPNGNASGINESNYVVGFTSTTAFSTGDGRNITRGFIWHDDNNNGVSDPGEMKDLGTLGGDYSSALRINAANEIVGWSDAVGISTPRAIRWKNNFMLDLNAAIPQNSGWMLIEARGISDNGKIAGYGTINGVQHAYLLTPSLVSQTVNFDPIANKTYGNAPFTVSATASSNLPVTFSVMSGPATVNGNTVTITGAGLVTLRASQTGDGTYDSAFADQTFTVAPALLRVIADSKTKVFGAPNPAFTVHYSGFVNSDTASALSGSLSFSTAADNSPVGSYSITPSGLASNNYTFQYLSATLTIDQASTSTSSGNYNLPVPGPVSLVAQVTGDSPSTLPVGQGTVTFVVRQGAATIGAVTSGQVSNGQASASFTVPAGGAYTIYASYGGTGNYLGSTGLASLTVGNANPVPSITGVTPDSAVKKPTESGQFTLLIDGNGFMSTANGDPANSSVDWYDRTTGQHTNLSLTSITAAQIQAVVPFTLIRDGKTVEVTVINPGPGGGASNVQPFFVTDTTATITSTETVIPDPSTGTASTTSVTPSGAVLSAEASSGGSGGTGTLSVAQYSCDPIGTNSSPNSSAFSTAEGSGYFDVYVAPGSSFTSLTLEYSNTGGTTLYWWDGTVWALVSNQSYNPATGTITVTVTATSSPSIAQLTGTVFGVASGPSVGSITVTPSASVALGSGPVTLNAAIVDPSGTGPYTAEINWGDGQTSTLLNVTGLSVSASHAYAVAGSYSISVKVSRGSSFGTSTFSPLVVFNPAAGSMNADGWFNAPLGSYPANPAFAGKIHFESNVKYANGATIPTGTAKVNLPGKDFVAGSLSWLTISGSNLQLSGVGTVNDAGSYGILLTGIDGKLDGKKMPDKVRLKIWNRANGQIVYDSQMNAPDNTTPAIVLGGGNINIKK